MAFLTELWLPIVVASIGVFIASSIIHMVLPFHRNDFKKMAGEDDVTAAIRSADVAPGVYMFPCAETMQEMKSPEMCEKLDTGPVGWLTVMPKSSFNMGRNLLLWFMFTVLAGVFIAYISWHALGAGAEYLKVFQFVGTAGFLAYAIGYLHDSIWKGAPWNMTLKFIFDGIVYAAVTAGIFGWLWPAASV